MVFGIVKLEGRAVFSSVLFCGNVHILFQLTHLVRTYKHGILEFFWWY